MADRGIRIPLIADVRDWLRGTDRVERSVDELGRDLDDLARTADRAAGNTANDFRGAFRRIENDSRDLDQNLERNIGRGSFRGAAGALAAEAGGEFIQSWGEAIRSGNPAEVLREVGSQLALIGGAVGGPVGAAAGAVASFFVVQLYDRVAGEAKERKEEAQQAYDALFSDVDDKSLRERGKAIYDSIVQGYVDRANVGQNLAQALDVDSSLEAWEQVDRLAGDTGLSVQTVTDALLGNKEAIDEVQRGIGENEAAYDKLRARVAETSELEGGARVQALKDALEPLDNQVAAMNELAEASERTADAIERAADAERVALTYDQSRLTVPDTFNQPVQLGPGGGVIP